MEGGEGRGRGREGWEGMWWDGYGGGEVKLSRLVRIPPWAGHEEPIPGGEGVVLSD